MHGLLTPTKNETMILAKFFTSTGRDSTHAKGPLLPLWAIFRAYQIEDSFTQYRWKELLENSQAQQINSDNEYNSLK